MSIKISSYFHHYFPNCSFSNTRVTRIAASVFTMFFILYVGKIWKSRRSNLLGKTTILLIRHGQTEWNKEEKIQGQKNIPLNTNGIEQAKALALTIKKTYPHMHAIYSSDLTRAIATAQFIAKQYNLPIVRCQSLREINKGSMEGVLYSEVFDKIKRAEQELKYKYPNRDVRWKQPAIGGGETLFELEKRCRKTLFDISYLYPNKIVAVITHGTVIRVILARIQDCDISNISVSNCTITKINCNVKNKKSPFTLIERNI